MAFQQPGVKLKFEEEYAQLQQISRDIGGFSVKNDGHLVMMTVCWDQPPEIA